MQRDLQTKRQIEKAMDIFRWNNIKSDYIYVPARPVHSMFFFQRSAFITPAMSAQIVGVLKKYGTIDENGYIIKDPRLVSTGTVLLIASSVYHVRKKRVLVSAEGGLQPGQLTAYLTGVAVVAYNTVPHACSIPGPRLTCAPAGCLPGCRIRCGCCN